MSEFKFEYIERTHSPEEFGAVFDRLFNTHLEHQLLLSEEETLKSKLETMKQDIELSKSVLQEETRITVRELGSQLRIENAHLSVVSEIIDIEKHRKSRGHEGVISGPAYEIVLDYVDIFSMSLTLYYPWRRHVVVEYSFRWPNCGCQMHDSMHLHDDDSGDYVIDCVKRALSRFLGARIEDGELRCPKCQVCEMDLDYECEGYEESYPLDVERGYASRKEMEEKYGL